MLQRDEPAFTVNLPDGTQITAAAISPDGLLMAAAANGKIWLIDSRGGDILQTIDAPEVQQANHLQFSADHAYLAAVQSTGIPNLHIWRTEDAAPVAAFAVAADTVEVNFSPDSSTVLVTAPHDLSLWDIAAGQRTISLPLQLSPVSALTASPDGKWIAWASGDGNLHIREALSSSVIRELPIDDSQAPANSLSFRSDGRWLGYIQQGSLKLWQTEYWQAIELPNNQNNRVAAFTFSPDNYALAILRTNGSAELWQTRAGDATLLNAIKSEGGRSLAFSPDGKQLAVGNADGSISLWRTASGQSAGAIKGHLAPVTALAYSPNGQQLASISADDGQISLWNMNDLTLQRSLQGVTGPVLYTPDGQVLITLMGAANGAARPGATLLLLLSLIHISEPTRPY
jgi:WD40 repeat protein